jgi:hypothetical protein
MTPAYRWETPSSAAICARSQPLSLRAAAFSDCAKVSAFALRIGNFRALPSRPTRFLGLALGLSSMIPVEALDCSGSTGGFPPVALRALPTVV